VQKGERTNHGVSEKAEREKEAQKPARTAEGYSPYNSQKGSPLLLNRLNQTSSPPAVGKREKKKGGEWDLRTWLGSNVQEGKMKKDLGQLKGGTRETKKNPANNNGGLYKPLISDEGVCTTDHAEPHSLGANRVGEPLWKAVKGASSSATVD